VERRRSIGTHYTRREREAEMLTETRGRVLPEAVEMLAWARTGEGWALNLDGTDAAAEFSFPRLELHSSPRGWLCLCRLANGTSHRLGPLGTTPAAKRAALEQARSVLGPPYAGVLDQLLAGR
jgi:hypothetical protein